MVRNLSAGRPTRLWLVALALLVGVGAFVAHARSRACT